MFAGLPGIGVGTLFYVLAGLVMPLVELTRSLSGDVSAARWRVAIAQFCFAVSIVASVALADRVFTIILSDRNVDNLNLGRLVNDTVAARAPESIWAAPVMASVLLLTGVLASMEVIRLVTSLTRPRSPRVSKTTELLRDFEA
jgi:hypothetical protein